jgi:hypothetical protein
VILISNSEGEERTLGLVWAHRRLQRGTRQRGTGLAGYARTWLDRSVHAENASSALHQKIFFSF